MISPKSLRNRKSESMFSTEMSAKTGSKVEILEGWMRSSASLRERLHQESSHVEDPTESLNIS